MRKKKVTQRKITTRQSPALKKWKTETDNRLAELERVQREHNRILVCQIQWKDELVESLRRQESKECCIEQIRQIGREIKEMLLSFSK